jgi:DNA ligase-1
MKFKEFAEFLDKIEQVSGRNDMTIALAEFFTKLQADEAKLVMYFLQGRLAPQYIPIEFNFSDKMAIRALDVKYEKDAKQMLGVQGDLGNVVAELRITNYELREDKELEVAKVYDMLTELTDLTGKGSQEGKVNKYLEIIGSLDPLSGKYVTRIILGQLRIGFSLKTILDAFSWFLVGDKSLRSDIDVAFGARADIGELASIIIKNKDKDIKSVLEEIKIIPMTPVASKLVEREASPEAVWKRMPNCFVQPKLDGLRGQIHYSKSGIKNEELGIVDYARIFSRNMEDLTDNFPEIIENVKNLGVDSVILDSEIIGFDSESETYRTYQDTMKRRRKYDVDLFSKDIPVKAMCFDVLYFNGEDITKKKIEERLEILDSLLKNNKGALTKLETKQMQSESELTEYFEDKVGMGLEGIITKSTESIYEPGTRNFKWIKLKANTKSELVDTIDVAILGYYYGQGARSKHGFGAVLAGVYNPEDGKYYSIGKVGSGITDIQAPEIFAAMQQLSIRNEELGIDKRPENYVVSKMLYPDVWVRPGIVSEIVADEITRSPSHTAAINMPAKVKNDDQSKGLSIRFPRIKIWKRDKDLPNTVSEIVRMYELRKGK